MTSLKNVLKQELSKPKYKGMAPAQIVTYLNAREQSFQKVTMPKGKRFSVEPTLLLSKARISPETMNKLLKHKKTKEYLKAFLSKPIKFEEFDYWREIIDWLATANKAWYHRKKLLSREQCEALKKVFDEAAVRAGGKKVMACRGPIRIKKLTGNDSLAVHIKDIEDFLNARTT